MARRVSDIAPIVIGIVALAAGIHLAIIPTDVGWRITGIVLVAVTCLAGFGWRLMKGRRGLDTPTSITDPQTEKPVM